MSASYCSYGSDTNTLALLNLAEFKFKGLDDFLKSNNVYHHISLNTAVKANYSERVILTLKRIMYRMFNKQRSYQLYIYNVAYVYPTWIYHVLCLALSTYKPINRLHWTDLHLLEQCNLKNSAF
jgi:hypothetical protein